VRAGVKIELLSRDRLPDLASFGRKPLPRFRADDVTELADHEADFRRWTYRREGRFDRERLAAAVRALPPQLLRLKGSCRITDDPAPKIFQMVAQDWCLTPPDGEGVQFFDTIMLVGVGTSDLPDQRELDAILDRALAVTTVAP
jgi:G3E family GTPase